MMITLSNVFIWIFFQSVVVSCTLAGCLDADPELTTVTVCHQMKKTDTSLEIYLNAIEAELFATYDCECKITLSITPFNMYIHAKKTPINRYRYFNIITEEFRKDDNISLTNEETIIRFQVKKDGYSPDGCLILKPLSGLMTIECLTGNQKYGETQERTATIVTTEGVIAGAVGGGVVLVIVVIVIVIVYKRRQVSNNTTQSSDNGRKESDYDMTENAMYNCDESDNKPKTNSTAAQEVEYEYITSDVSKSLGTGSCAYDNAIEQKSRPNNDINSENENEYNHVDQSHTKTPPNTGNIYNVLKPGNTTENNLDENDYDCTDNSNNNYRQNVTSLYSKAV